MNSWRFALFLAGAVPGLGFFLWSIFSPKTDFGGPDDPAPDPAVVASASKNGHGYGGMDRWAYQGMGVYEVIALLKARGFECEVPPDLKTPAAFVEGVVPCAKRTEGLLARTQRISVRAASMGYNVRFVSAQARLTEPGLVTGIGGPLWRALGWIEPLSLDISGLRVATPQLLAAVMLDRVAPNGWHGRCADRPYNRDCEDATRARKVGFAPYAEAALPSMSTCELFNALQLVGLRSRAPEAAQLETLAQMTPFQRMPVRYAVDATAGAGAAPTAAPAGATAPDLEAQLIGQDPVGTPHVATLILNGDNGRVKRLRLSTGEVSKQWEVPPADRVGCQTKQGPERSALVLQQPWSALPEPGNNNPWMTPWWFLAEDGATLASWLSRNGARLSAVTGPQRSKIWRAASELPLENNNLKVMVAPAGLQLVAGQLLDLGRFLGPGDNQAALDLDLLRELQATPPKTPEFLWALTLARCDAAGVLASNGVFNAGCWQALTLTWPEGAAAMKAWAQAQLVRPLVEDEDARLQRLRAILLTIAA